MYTACNLEVELCEALKRCYQKYDEDKSDDGEHVCDEGDEYYQKDYTQRQYYLIVALGGRKLDIIEVLQGDAMNSSSGGDKQQSLRRRATGGQQLLCTHIHHPPSKSTRGRCAIYRTSPPGHFFGLF